MLEKSNIEFHNLFSKLNQEKDLFQKENKDLKSLILEFESKLKQSENLNSILKQENSMLLSNNFDLKNGIDDKLKIVIDELVIEHSNHISILNSKQQFNYDLELKFNILQDQFNSNLKSIFIFIFIFIL
jgi:hypothetical protein